MKLLFREGQQMDRKQANKIIGKSKNPNGGLHSLGGLYSFKEYLRWDIGNKKATLDGKFTADELEAIAWWMRKGNKKGGKNERV